MVEEVIRADSKGHCHLLTLSPLALSLTLGGREVVSLVPKLSGGCLRQASVNVLPPGSFVLKSLMLTQSDA